MTQIRLGDLLIKAGVVNDAQLNAALNEQRQWGGRLGAILVRMGALSEDLLVKALSRQLNIPRAQIGPTDVIQVPPQILERLDRATCEKGLFLPVQYIQERRALQVAVADPFNVVALDDLSRRVGLRIETLIAGETQVLQAIGRVYGGGGGIDQSIQGNESGLGFVDNSGNSMSRGPSPAAQPTTQPPTSMAPQPTQPPGFPAPGPLGPGYAPGFAQPPSTQPPQMSAPMMTPSMQQPVMQPPQMAPPASTGFSQPPQMARPGPPQAQDDLRVLAEQQLRAVRALVELLIERGVVSRAELQAWMGR